MDIILSEKAKEYITRKRISNLEIKISFFSERCVQIFEPKVQVISDKNLDDFVGIRKEIVDGIVIYISDQFSEIYKEENKDIHIELHKFPKKKLIIKNIDPIIIQTCKIDK